MAVKNEVQSCFPVVLVSCYQSSCYLCSSCPGGNLLISARARMRGFTLNWHWSQNLGGLASPARDNRYHICTGYQRYAAPVQQNPTVYQQYTTPAAESNCISAICSLCAAESSCICTFCSLRLQGTPQATKVAKSTTTKATY